MELQKKDPLASGYQKGQVLYKWQAEAPDERHLRIFRKPIIQISGPIVTCTDPLEIRRGHSPTRIFRRQVVTLYKPTYQVLPLWSAGVWSSRWPRPGMLNRYIVTDVMCDIIPDIVFDIVPDIASDVVVYLRWWLRYWGALHGCWHAPILLLCPCGNSMIYKPSKSGFGMATHLAWWLSGRACLLEGGGCEFESLQGVNISGYRWFNQALESVRGFRPSQFMRGILYLEYYLISGLNDYCKRKETPENGYLDSSRLV